MRGTLLLTLIICLFAVSVSYAGTNLFEPYTAFPTGSWPEAVAIGDVNGDGRNDVVLTTSFYFDPANDYHIHVFLQNASGALNPPARYPTNSTYSSGPSSVDIGDVNNDGRADVVVGNSGSNIEVFLQNSYGSLDPGRSYLTVNSESIKIGDFNNDGLLDVAGIGWGTNQMDIFFQNESGILTGPVTNEVTHGGYDEIEAGDVNNDGLEDIIVMSGQSYSYPNIGVLFQGPGGTFSLPVYYDLPGSELTHGVAIGDLDSDSLEDIVVTYGGNSPSSKIGVFYQNNTGALDPAFSYTSYDCPEPVEVADVNGDGKQDVIVAHGGWTELGIYLQGPDKDLISEELYPIPYASHYNPQGLAVGDINGDGFNDVVIADYNNGLVVLYHNDLRFEENEPSIYYKGTWLNYRCKACSGGAFAYSNETSANASFSFYGTGLKWIVTKNNNFGKAKVYLDGAYMGLVDLYSRLPKTQISLQKTGLPAGNHTLHLEVSGQKNPNSSGYYINLDALEVIP